MKVLKKELESHLIAKELGDRWVETMFYYRTPLKVEQSEEYRIHLITPWNKYKMSFSNKFLAGYQYGTNNLSIYQHRKHNEISSVSLLETIQIDEDGFLYGVGMSKIIFGYMVKKQV